MKPWRSRRLRAVAATALIAGAAGIAIAQSAPESLLPPGFGAPPPSVPPPPSPSVPRPGAPGAPPTAAPAPVVPGAIPVLDIPPPTADDLLDPAEKAAKDAERELPKFARRPVDPVGLLSPAQGGLGPDAFGRASGTYLATLLHRLNAPIPSRWASITLRRALISRAAAPVGIKPVDWVAERAWLLLRMGEADAARGLVQAVDTDRYDRWMVAVARQASLATADPAGLCPIAQMGQAAAPDDPSWGLIQAMCAALSGEGGTATAMIERQRRRGRLSDIDLRLTEKVAGAGLGGRRAVKIDWAGVIAIDAWRFGLANALAVEVPMDLYATAGPQVRAWAARAPMMSVRQRLPFARTAAAMGVFSSAALVDLYGSDADETDAMETDGSTAQRLRDAYVAGSVADRLTALRSLWGNPAGPMDRYAGLILTARAAARIAPSADHGEDVADLVGAMLSAGLDAQAARWGKVVDGMGDDGDAAWALLAVGAPAPTVDLSVGRIESYAGNVGGHRTQLLVAALAGLGRLPVADAVRLGGPIDARSRWSDALALAAQAGQPGTVAVLSATGLQAADWAHVPASHLYHIVVALRRTGQDAAARMIAAEALTRS